jgi:DNA-directed RNA polymerase specialized sigma24 family protein
MKLFGAKTIADHEATPYATRADFCRIFQDDMNRLYLLSFLLTADEATAEKCFVGGLRMSKEGTPVFKEWAESWARRAIILNAIRMIRPRPTDDSVSPASDRGAGRATTEPAEIADIVELPAFERFAFVMSVLERYSDHECSLLLACTHREVTEARTRALQRIGRSAERRHKLVTIGADQRAPRDNAPVLRLEPVAPLAASA